MAIRTLTATKTAIIHQLAFAPDGSRLAAACDKSNARVWDLDSGKGVALKETPNLEFVGFARGPDELVTSKWDTSASLRDLRTGSVRLLGPAAGPEYCWDNDLSGDGTRLVRVEREGIICRNVADGKLLWKTTWQQDPVFHHRARFGGGRVFFAGRHIRILDADTGSEIGKLDLTFREDGALDMMAVSPDGRWLALRGDEGMQIRDTSDGRLVLEAPEITYAGFGLTFTPDGTRLAATRWGNNAGIAFWTVPAWRAAKAWKSTIGSVNAVAFSPDGKLIAAGGFNGQVVVWDFK
jgi:hypothetical protein